ncbi:uncharacterized protein LOC134656091 [Cydia amplana]|uniref:uncharacterized protein LOC134656091 n=1 Tax=Cydia amplana TaxID=1869771 RepID=UPI002FE64C8C
MVNTRSTTRRERERKAEEDRQLQLQVPSQPTNGNNAQNNDEIKINVPAFKLSGSSVKSEHRPAQHNTPASLTGAKSKSSSSSVLARIKQLELEAAQEKARIQMALIDKKLEADLANLMDEEQENYSPHDDLHTDTQDEVEKWLERSQRELESAAQQVPDHGNQPDLPCPPPVVDPGTSNGTIQMLASALQNLTASTAKQKSDKNLLSRLCTPRDLPSYSGDSLDWLQFKQAYEESTEVCGFSPKENLWRLRKCLHGTAREAVSALMVTATSPDIVMKTLELVCGNPESILTRIMQGLRKLPSMSNEYSKDIVFFSVKVQNFIAAVHAVGRKEYLHDVNMANIILSKLPTVIISKWSDYSFPIIAEGKKPRLEILGDFLDIEAVKITTTANIHVTDQRSSYQHHSKNKSDNNNANRQQTVLLQSAQARSDNKCLFCRGAKHELTECKMFKKALRKDRWRHVKRHGVCFKCLVSCHDRKNCPAPACDKDGCGEAHHRLLHYVQHRDTDKDATSESPDKKETAESSPTNETVSFININDHKVLLKVVPIKIRGPNGVFMTSAFLDDGSSISLISKSLAERAGLRGRTETMRVSGAWKDSDLECTYTVVSIDVSSLNGSETFNVNLRAVDNLEIPEQDFRSIDCNKFAHLQKLKDKWSPNVISCNPEVLIGQDNYDLIMPLEICKGKPLEPFATRTVLGWSVHGKTRAPHGRGPRAAHNLLLAAADCCPSAHDDALRDLHEEVRRYFSIDSLGVCNKPRQNSDDVRALAQLDRTTTFADGRWQVGLPWRDENSVMPDSYPNALNRLKGVEKKMAANSEYAQRYTDRVNHLFQNDFAREVIDPRSASPHTWYLPHHAVDNLNKKKLRLVFDCAAKSKGTSLNDYLLQGPDLLASLFGIMVRFRENRYAVAGDLRDMFLRVKIRPEDQDALRFLWRTDSKQPVKTYAMTSLVFGANSSPFIAQYVKNRNAQRYASTMPAAVAAICEQHYMDDYLDSLPDEAAAIKMVKDVTFIHKQGGFDMCNWTSNSEAVLDSVPKEALGTAALRFKLDRQQEDIATRETYDDALFQNEWLKGPSFLGSDESSWPRNIVGTAAVEPERSEIINIINDLPATYLPVFNPERFSSWLRLLRSTYHVLVFVHKCRKQTYDDSELMRRAELLLVRQVQEECFGAELAAIRKGMSLERNSRILTWSPYLDDCGVLRCGGRINAAQGVGADTKYPIILDGRHQVTRLLVKHYHIRAAHDYQETVVNNLKEKYAITKIRPTVKHVATRCMFCKIRKAQPHVPVMGELPPGRMAHHQRPFTHCGLDLFGPMEVVVGRGRQKRYGVIFTCLTVRAIHLEIVHSLTTDSLIIALRRMASRRGWPDCFYSDNGTNLRGADTELKRSVRELDNKAVNDFALTNGSSWKFIPPASPHWGGAWERLIRSVKKSLSVVLKERAPKDEVLSTLMAEVENIVNSRPLTHVSVEPGSDGALTPNHFLLHSPPNTPALGAFDDSDLFLRKQWRTSQRLADMYWQRWVKEYLPELLPRRKWNTEQTPLKVGDLVLVVDPGAPRNVWPKAVIQQVFPGRDGRVRLVEIKTKSGVFKRPAARVARIPLVNEC